MGLLLGSSIGSSSSDGRLGTLDNCANSLCGSTASVNLHELGQIEAGLLENLDLADEHVVERVDALALALDLLANRLRDELLEESLQVRARGLAGHDVAHLLADGTDLRGLSIRGLPELVGAALGETNGEHAQEIAISGLDLNVGLDDRLPLTNQRTQLVGAEAHAVEVGEARLALNVLDGEAHHAESLLLVLVQVRKRDLENATLERIGRNF